MQWGPRRIDFQLHAGEETGVGKTVKRRQEAGLPMCIGSMSSGTRPVEWACPFLGLLSCLSSWCLPQAPAALAVLWCVGRLCPPRGPLCPNSGSECWPPSPLTPYLPPLPTQETLLRLLLKLLLRPPAPAPAPRTSAMCSWWSSSEAPRGWGWA